MILSSSQFSFPASVIDEPGATTYPISLRNQLQFQQRGCPAIALGGVVQTGPRNGCILANGERPLSRVENLLLMLDWAVAGSLIPLDSRGLAVPESFAKRVFALILC